MDRLRKRRSARTRYHIRRQALMKELPNVKKKAKKLSNARAREAFYKKHEAKCEAHEAKINFFKRRPPKKRSTRASGLTQYVPTQTPKPRPMSKPKLTWATAKQQVFDDSRSNSSSEANNSYNSDGYGNDHGIPGEATPVFFNVEPRF